MTPGGVGEGQGPFSNRALAWVLSLGGLSLLGTVFFGVFGGSLRTPESIASDSYSYSLVGHRALVEVLRKLGVPVLSSRHGSASKLAGGQGLLILAEPGRPQSLLEALAGRAGGRAKGKKRSEAKEGDAADPVARVGRLLEASTSPVLLVLPKWRVAPGTMRPGWAGKRDLIATSEVAASLEPLALGTVRILRPADAKGWRTSFGGLEPTLERPQLLASKDAPLSKDARVVPEISNDDGVLLARIERKGHKPPLYVLSDPDLLANRGLVAGRNADLVVALVERLRAGGAVVFDETIHGLEEVPGLAAELGRFPVVLIFIQILLALALWVWAGLQRFGAPRTLPPSFAPGKEFLIENTAKLFAFGGHARHSLRRYRTAIAREVAAALRAPANLDPQAQRAFLDRLAPLRGAHVTDSTLHDEIDAVKHDRDAPRLALRLHQWKREMIDGRSGGRRA